MATEHVDGGAVREIAALAEQGLNGEARIVEVDGRPFSTTSLTAVLPPKLDEPDTLVVHTLTAIGDYVEDNVDALTEGDLMIHVVNPDTVHLLSRLQEPRAQRFLYLAARSDDRLSGFRFGQWYDTQEMIIALQSRFGPTEHRDELLRLMTNIRGEAVQTSKDDGVSQEVEVRGGVYLKGTERVPTPALLKPHRTFAEVEQPQSPFVFRVRSAARGEGFEATLIEGDGGAWKLEATRAIAEFVDALVKDVTVIS